MGYITHKHIIHKYCEIRKTLTFIKKDDNYRYDMLYNEKVFRGVSIMIHEKLSRIT